MTDEKQTNEEPKTKKAPSDFMGALEYYFTEKAPFQLPKNAKDWIVKYGPWIVLVIILLSLPAILTAIGFSFIAIPFTGAYATSLSIGVFFTIAQVALQGAALPGLFNRKIQGWNFMFYSVLVGLASGLVTTVLANFGAFFGALLGAVIGLYVLFQIKPYYKK